MATVHQNAGLRRVPTLSVGFDAGKVVIKPRALNSRPSKRRPKFCKFHGSKAPPTLNALHELHHDFAILHRQHKNTFLVKTHSNFEHVYAQNHVSIHKQIIKAAVILQSMHSLCSQPMDNDPQS